MNSNNIKIIAAAVILLTVCIIHVFNPEIDGGLDNLAALSAGFLFGSGIKPSS